MKSKRNVWIVLIILMLSPGIVIVVEMIKNPKEIGYLSKIMTELVVIYSVPFLIYLVGKILANKKYKNEVFSSIDIKKYEGYFRDILKNHSIGQLSYIDDFKLDDKDIVSTLLQMEMNGIIRLDQDIEIINKDGMLYHSEICILKNIKNGKLDINIYEFEECIKKEALAEKLIKKKSFGGWLPFFTLCGSILCFIMSNFIVPILLIFGLEFMVNWIIIGNVLGIILFIFTISYLITIGLKPSYERTKIGESMNEKLEGLKNYLNDYSMLEDRNKEEIAIWEEYLIYSVMFGQNKKIEEEIKRKYITNIYK